MANSLQWVKVGTIVFWDTMSLVPNDAGAIGFSANSYNIACSFTPTTSFTCTGAGLSLRNNQLNSTNFQMVVGIYTNVAGAVGALIGTASRATDANPVGLASSEIIFNGISAAVTASTQYWLVCSASTLPPLNGNDFIKWDLLGGQAENELNLHSDNTTAASNAGFEGLFRLYGYA